MHYPAVDNKGSLFLEKRPNKFLLKISARFIYTLYNLLFTSNILARAIIITFEILRFASTIILAYYSRIRHHLLDTNGGEQETDVEVYKNDPACRTRPIIGNCLDDDTREVLLRLRKVSTPNSHLELFTFTLT